MKGKVYYQSSSDDDEGGSNEQFKGNTNQLLEKKEKPEKSKKKKREAPKIHWVFTWNNYPEGWFQGFQDFPVWKENHIKFYSMGIEIGEEKTPHIQGYLELRKKNRLSWLKKMTNDQIHWIACKDPKAYKSDAIEYTQKDGDFYTNLRGRRPLVWPEKWYEWQEECIQMCCETKADDRTIVWLYESKGCTGKTTLVKYLVAEKQGHMIPAKSSDAAYALQKLYEGGDPMDLILVDIPRTAEGYLNYGSIECCKNGLVVSGKYEGAEMAFASPHVLCFANFAPDTTKMSMDRWKIGEIVDNKIIWKGSQEEAQQILSQFVA